MNIIDKVVWRNDALWLALTGADLDERKAALDRALGDPCPHCNGTGSAETGTRHGGWGESIACDWCDGTGAVCQ
jgi:hypothetical protein